jgi:serine/threonine-protein kinase
MANVYLALPPGVQGVSDLKNLVVIKSLREPLASSPVLCRMLLDEARRASRLRHPNVVQTNEVGHYAGRPALIMEYLEGQPLAAILSHARIGERMRLSMHLKILAEAVAGLDYAHDLVDLDGSPLNLVHRDVSPSNVFVTFDGRVKVLDFGIAKAATSSHNTIKGELKSKIAYMAPEQMLGERVIDRRADIFAVGVMIWEAAAGRRMWEGCNEVTIMRRVLNDQIPKLREVNPGAPERLVRLCEKALALDRAQRYAIASELAKDLEAVIAGLAETIKTKDIVKYVSSMFADVRSRTRKAIEDQTKVLEAGNDAPPEPVALAELLDRWSSGVRLATTRSLESPRSLARRGVWIWAVVAAVAIGGTIVLAKRRPFAAANPPPAPTATAAPAPS